MKSEALAVAAAAVAPGDIIEALRERVDGSLTGEAVDLRELQQADPFGPGAFAALAGRFGLSDQGQGIWLLGRKPRWEPGWIGPEHEAQCFDLFEKAFGYRIDPRLWRWKYRDAPQPGMGVWRDGELVAFYGAMPRPVLFLGRPASTVQIGDVMVDPAERGVMTRSGPFRIAASTFIDRSVGYERPHLFGFGFPTAKALQVAQKLGLYEHVDQMTELSWQAAANWPARLLRCTPVTARDRATIDGLWQAMAADFRESILGVRDAHFVEQRYQRHPTVSYHCLLVRSMFTGAPRGVIVLRRLDETAFELMDLVGPRNSFAALVAAARHWAARNGATRLRAWVTTSHAELLAATSPTQTPLDLVVPANVWSPGPSAGELRGRWWLMSGDTDFR
ncbi:MAG: family N-acetyltransferase [Ramlibacter sp.]|nr:family N-acetyltransferase [Ramlibacter sp.]